VANHGTILILDLIIHYLKRVPHTETPSEVPCALYPHVPFNPCPVGEATVMLTVLAESDTPVCGMPRAAYRRWIY